MERFKEFIEEHRMGGFYGGLGAALLILLGQIENTQFAVYIIGLGIILGFILDYLIIERNIGNDFIQSYPIIFIVAGVALLIYLLRFIPGSPIFSVIDSITQETQASFGKYLGGSAALASLGKGGPLGILATLISFPLLFSGGWIISLIGLVGFFIFLGIPIFKLSFAIADNFTLILILAAIVLIIVALASTRSRRK